MLTQDVLVVEPSRSSANPSSGYVTHTLVVTHDHEKEKEDLIRAWEEELARIENASRRSSAGMLAFFGGAGRKLRGRLGTGPREGKVGVGAG